MIEKDNEEIKDLQGKLEMEIQAKTDAEKKMFRMQDRESSIIAEMDAYKQMVQELKEQRKVLDDKIALLEEDKVNKSDKITELVRIKRQRIPIK